MNSYRRNNSRRPAQLFAAVLALGLLVVVGTYTRVGDMARMYAVHGVASASRAAESLNVSTRLLRSENETLRAENESLREKILADTRYADENARLRALLVAVDHTRVIATARVVTRPGFSPYGTFTIGAGSQDGVSEGALVVGEGAIALGFVTEVGNTTSVVALFSAPGKTLDARLSDNALISYVGAGNGSGEAQVPRGLTIGEHASVFLPGTGYLLGTVATTTGTPEDPSLHLYIASPVPLSSLEYVSVLPQ